VSGNLTVELTGQLVCADLAAMFDSMEAQLQAAFLRSRQSIDVALQSEYATLKIRVKAELPDLVEEIERLEKERELLEKEHFKEIEELRKQREKALRECLKVVTNQRSSRVTGYVEILGRAASAMADAITDWIAITSLEIESTLELDNKRRKRLQLSIDRLSRTVATSSALIQSVAGTVSSELRPLRDLTPQREPLPEAKAELRRRETGHRRKQRA
jgi:uncharacterized protein (UPF0335 family)